MDPTPGASGREIKAPDDCAGRTETGAPMSATGQENQTIID
jgi:hypothetical protein